MDLEWRDEVQNLNLRDQWDHLYKRQIKKDNPALWATGNGRKNAEVIISELPNIFEQYKIKTFLDVGCGNFFWMHKVNFSGVKYLGVDIVNDLILENIKNYPSYDFKCLNIVEQKIPAYDMVFLRSVFIHLQNDDILKALKNIKESGSKYLLCTTSPQVEKNGDTLCLMLVRRNLEIEPFNLGKPIKYYEERPGRFMALWKI